MSALSSSGQLRDNRADRGGHPGRSGHSLFKGVSRCPVLRWQPNVPTFGASRRVSGCFLFIVEWLGASYVRQEVPAIASKIELVTDRYARAREAHASVSSKFGGKSVPEGSSHSFFQSPRAKGAPRGSKGNTALQIADEMRQEVRALARLFPVHPQWYIANKIGVARSTLNKYFQEDLIAGRDEMLADVGGQMIQLALQGKDARNANGTPVACGDFQAMKFVLAKFGGWSAKAPVEQCNQPPGEPVDLSCLTDEELDQLQRIFVVAPEGC